MTGQLPPAGWYEDGQTIGMRRWWNGNRWTDDLQPYPPSIPPPPKLVSQYEVAAKSLKKIQRPTLIAVLPVVGRPLAAAGAVCALLVAGAFSLNSTPAQQTVALSANETTIVPIDSTASIGEFGSGHRSTDPVPSPSSRQGPGSSDPSSIDQAPEPTTSIRPDPVESPTTTVSPSPMTVPGAEATPTPVTAVAPESQTEPQTQDQRGANDLQVQPSVASEPTVGPDLSEPTGIPPVSAVVRTPGCDLNYSGCVPIAVDVDCADGGGDGPAFVVGPVVVVGRDVYGLDWDLDGVACE